MNIRIQQISDNSSQNDLEKFIETFLVFFNDQENLLYLSFTNLPFTKELVQNWITQAGQSGVTNYAAYDQNDQIIGILTIRFNSIEVFEILALVVGKPWRKSGVGQQLVETAIKQAREKGFKAVDVAVFADNKRMLSLMIKHDFKPVRIEYHKRFDGEDIIYLKRHLAEEQE